MDLSESLILGYVALVISIATAVVGVINHKRIKSKCCGKEGDISIDIETTSPTPTRVTPLLAEGAPLPLKSPPSAPSAPRAPAMLEG
jgi:hypothetical protein